MQDIDFLPAEYRQEHAQRRSQPWRIVVVGAFAAVIAVAAFGQHQRRTRLESLDAEITPAHEAAVQGNQGLQDLKSQLELARADAELFTYLRHRWPSTRILDALLASLPDEITFEQVEIRQEAPAGRLSVGSLSREEREAEDERLAGLPPAARDLGQLREQFDVEKTVVTITGLTTDSGALHRYLGKLSRVELFRKAELDTIDSDQIGGAAKLRFSVSLVVRPGYGQAGGPTGEDHQRPAEIDRSTT